MNKRIIISLLLLTFGINASAMELRFWPQVSNNWADGRNWLDTVNWQGGLEAEYPLADDDAVIPEFDVVVDSDANSVEVVYLGVWYNPTFNVDGIASLTLTGNAKLRVEMRNTGAGDDKSNSGVFSVGETNAIDANGEYSGTLTINGGQLDVDHALWLGNNYYNDSPAKGLLVMNGGQLNVGFNPQPGGYPALYVGTTGAGHIEVNGGTIACNWLEMNGWGANSVGTIQFTGGGGKIIIVNPDPDGVLATLEPYIQNGSIARAKAEVVGATVEITDKCGELLGDLDDNCQVDLQDFMLLAKDWLKDATP